MPGSHDAMPNDEVHSVPLKLVNVLPDYGAELNLASNNTNTASFSYVVKFLADFTQRIMDLDYVLRIATLRIEPPTPKSC